MERKCKSCDYNNWRQCGVDFCMLPFCTYKYKRSEVKTCDGQTNKVTVEKAIKLEG